MKNTNEYLKNLQTLLYVLKAIGVYPFSFGKSGNYK